MLYFKYAKNGVISLSELRKLNYPLFKFVTKNLDRVSSVLSNHGIEILDDTRTKKGYDRIRLYVKYHYGSEVNLSELRLFHKGIYTYLSKMGNIREILESMGFKVTYSSTLTDDELHKRIKEEGVTKYYNHVYYRAKKCNITVAEYLNKYVFVERTD